MNAVISEVPWGNLWRTVVTTLAFYALFLVCLIVVVSATGGGFGQEALIGLIPAGILACIAVWSDSVSWIGD
jgi:hypothetical protein